MNQILSRDAEEIQCYEKVDEYKALLQSLYSETWLVECGCPEKSENPNKRTLLGPKDLMLAGAEHSDEDFYRDWSGQDCTDSKICPLKCLNPKRSIFGSEEKEFPPICSYRAPMDAKRGPSPTDEGKYIAHAKYEVIKTNVRALRKFRLREAGEVVWPPTYRYGKSFASLSKSGSVWAQCFTLPATSPLQSPKPEILSGSTVMVAQDLDKKGKMPRKGTIGTVLGPSRQGSSSTRVQFEYEWGSQEFLLSQKVLDTLDVKVCLQNPDGSLDGKHNPGWTDRILLAGEKVTTKWYGWQMEPRFLGKYSDHAAVGAYLSVDF
eukprot:gnl/TRDRNA2_/TRDRNA2_136843_c3_seq1.p1 gnl/TRDRNA2_/TRDRNA2_136843_c3~~gnl/TRDRNA2_/TRDRNA2_136843_c3_seq1.p1  ORF type:complete len:346 (-),score=48.63 gnl/TRDRNA2_/TRDRNA2_136843_c3_seq1:352-1311(-)